MARQTKRPVFLNLFQIKLPAAALLSVAHRATGVVMFLLIPFCIYLLEMSVSDETGFHQVLAMIDSLPFQILLFLMLWILLHHLLAGIRYLLIDMDLGVDRIVARKSAWLVIFSGFASASLLGALL
ncbi:MAG: succinate dehydrogenase, cytochrome b556 subunit [gamma proteobacterium endosymbiont of Lamellibrachia anaximandri]|nr:succinate dehydrogenase, cytochrome b556 subunit [gamma proteobacterium endosymbiont of Lamellibrachia anaximandri]MBL3535434.1 succinate dehydrogenase, cytochrome b556 subunit [gamma proteobacterium endosymbiont of Lamellibrachia anaximandri]MBL3599595.1 succinate dehydrogenase, cytochrome b556 subunit [gamma proteobacterium endosymbiont of Lamellibrachia anaximandri]